MVQFTLYILIEFQLYSLFNPRHKKKRKKRIDMFIYIHNHIIPINNYHNYIHNNFIQKYNHNKYLLITTINNKFHI